MGLSTTKKGRKKGKSTGILSSGRGERKKGKGKREKKIAASLYKPNGGLN